MPRPTRTRSKCVSGRESVAGVLARCRTSGSTPASSAMARTSRKACSCSSVSGRSRFVRHGKVGEDSHHAEQALVLVFHGFAHQAVPGVQRCAVAAQAGVHLQVDARGAFLLPGGRTIFVQFPAGAADVDSGGNGGTEVALRGVQPGQQGGLDARGAQGQRLGNMRNTKPAGPGFERCPGHGNGAVPVGVRLHHGHDLGRRRHGRQPGGRCAGWRPGRSLLSVRCAGARVRGRAGSRRLLLGKSP